MVALTIIADPFPDWEAPLHQAAARDLTRAVAATAPRGCSARYVRARDTPDPHFESPRISTVEVPSPKRMLPLLWRAGAAARPLDGEFVHAMTPLAPLRGGAEELGTQSSVLIPNDISWAHPDLLPAPLGRSYRRLTKRAVKLADILLVTTHAAARELLEQYGADVPVQVIPLAAPTEILEPADSDERRAHFGLPGRYLVTTAPDNAHGRLSWITDALASDASLPPVVVIEGIDPELPSPGEAAPAPDPSGRVIRVKPRDLADVGAVIAGAELMLAPQSYSGTGYTVLAAFAAGVPLLHAGLDATLELALDAGVAAEDAPHFASELSRLLGTANGLDCLRVMARDRSRSFDWRNTAWQLWETHANL